jgi:hypothetical protein
MQIYRKGYKMKEAFLDYLKKQLERDDPIGDLARDWDQDKNEGKPKEITKLKELQDYLDARFSCAGADEAAEDAWAEWSAK